MLPYKDGNDQLRILLYFDDQWPSVYKNKSKVGSIYLNAIQTFSYLPAYNTHMIVWYNTHMIVWYFLLRVWLVAGSYGERSFGRNTTNGVIAFRRGTACFSSMEVSSFLLWNLLLLLADVVHCIYVCVYACVRFACMRACVCGLCLQVCVHKCVWICVCIHVALCFLFFICMNAVLPVDPVLSDSNHSESIRWMILQYTTPSYIIYISPIPSYLY